MGTKVKICGLMTASDIAAVNRAGADFAGFICSGGFRRTVSRMTVEQLGAMLDPEIRRVGVFVDEPVEAAASWLNDGVIDIAQLHGSEDELYIRELRQLTGFEKPQVRIVKAFRVHSPQDIRAAAASSADLVLLDSGAGSGLQFDWSLVRGIGRKFFLAGGLDPYNVGEAIRQVRPYAVDVSSGVETNGKKDPAKIDALVTAVRNAG